MHILKVKFVVERSLSNSINTLTELYITGVSAMFYSLKKISKNHTLYI
ncbi:hypothetical protein FLJC2902T_07590 [Flavobacterium limnosediminis JC2902]|uniref:Uncharacterized protein n=1 Tax=Flavobacterium limnosediminis JC2902 TaxID=1341181 RepID=V6ST62_9FLAO|nr:hypothetical protein FLJC2902T_07590 [Flavobacterium limnosediminis JC2902]